ncbi:Rne/Rng family ribonuclease [Acidaminobacter sp. JC074]|uniref:Rne/Rng family ribonuclease n=1 Tax=Acidaminobacter sp. JC074 TaxID=2530199 RepID=UPI001F0F60C2|nr:Rne/Rng family ribonuclease [Acidaminobacter sp. JC074]MCH4886662.1 Rne/Rng family ribonuclease [Acidaminobacter sp. JC074]
MKQLIVDYGLIYNRIALLEDGQLMEVFVENRFDKSLVGNIYLGRVVNVVKSMSAAFIDIGQKKNAYMPLEEGIKNGQEILVQVRRDAVGEKGATVTTDLSISGHYVVLLPMSKNHMASKKIRDKDKKKALINLTKDHLSEFGTVIRTEAVHASDDELISEMDRLKAKWVELEKYRRRIVSDKLLYEDYTFETLLEKEYLYQADQVILNHKPAVKKLYHDNVLFHDSDQPLFEAYKIDSQINLSLNREIKLSQGSIITIDETEALTAIDVNSAKFTGSSNKEETFLQVNLAAAKEIARQLRLRNISGIIIIDFINMQEDASYEFLQNALNKYFKKDKCHPIIHGLTTLGLMEVTRKKNRKSLKTQLFSECPTCSGSGYVMSVDMIVKKLMDKLRVLKAHTKKDEFIVKVSMSFYDMLLTSLDGNTYAGHLENLLEIDLDIEINDKLEGYDFQTSVKM